MESGKQLVAYEPYDKGDFGANMLENYWAATLLLSIVVLWLRRLIRRKPSAYLLDYATAKLDENFLVPIHDFIFFLSILVVLVLMSFRRKPTVYLLDYATAKWDENFLVPTHDCMRNKIASGFIDSLFAYEFWLG